MPTKQEKMAAGLAALSPSERARLERLASLAKVSPEQLWPDVWNYGFDDTEDSIRAEIEADEAEAAGTLIPNEEVMAMAAQIVEQYAQRKRKA
ncbi:hypothetical protein ACLB1G_11765 [Oxalobacteraceae bacterium A2-2]